MLDYSLETIGLTHVYDGSFRPGSRRTRVLDTLDLRVPEGSIYGFLGPNGAGKTTTLRLVLGLLKKQTGQIRVFGRPFEADRIGPLRRIGSLIETPGLYASLTAVENLRVLQRVYRCPATRIDEVLQLTGLADTGRKKAGKFSMGMKQRLAIAMALLHDPALLILDEPTNGLDPEGIVGMRNLFRMLNKEHRVTILISSHLLGEMEKLITHTGIIHKGRLLFQGPLETLKQAHAGADLETIFMYLTTRQP